MRQKGYLFFLSQTKIVYERKSAVWISCWMESGRFAENILVMRKIERP